MTKNIFKRAFSLLAVVMIMAMTAIPAFAASTSCTWDKSSNKGTGGDYCNTLCAMYGHDYEGTNKCMSYATDNTTEGYQYGLTVTNEKGATGTIYIKSRPDVNDVGVQMGTDGKLQVFGMGTGDANTWNQFFAKYKSVIVGISGIGAITFIALFMFQFMKLGASAGNPQARSQALTGCLWTGIAAAALGAVSIIAGFFYNAV